MNQASKWITGWSMDGWMDLWRLVGWFLDNFLDFLRCRTLSLTHSRTHLLPPRHRCPGWVHGGCGGADGPSIEIQRLSL